MGNEKIENIKWNEKFVILNLPFNVCVCLHVAQIKLQSQAASGFMCLKDEAEKEEEKDEQAGKAGRNRKPTCRTTRDVYLIHTYTLRDCCKSQSSARLRVCMCVCLYTVCACVCNLKCANCLYLRRQRKQFCERATLLAARVSFVCRTLNKINEGFVYGSCAVSANRPAACCGNVWHGRRMLLRQLLLLLLLLRLLLQASTLAATAPASDSAAATTFCWQLSPCTADTTQKKHIPVMIFRVGGGNNKRRRKQLSHACFELWRFVEAAWRILLVQHVGKYY